MRENALKKLWAQGGAAVNGWLSIPSAFSAEVMAHQGFDSLVIDMQHGVVDYQAAASMLAAISTTPVVPMARIPWNDPAFVMKILDAFAGLWCVNVGYGRKELADVAYKQLLELPYYNTFFKTTTPPAVELSQVLSDMTPDNLNYVFYGCSGSDANDSIVRMIRQFWNLTGKPKKKTIISRTRPLFLDRLAASPSHCACSAALVLPAQPNAPGRGPYPSGDR